MGSAIDQFTDATLYPAYCDISGNTAMQKFLKTMFSITVFAGFLIDLQPV